MYPVEAAGQTAESSEAEPLSPSSRRQMRARSPERVRSVSPQEHMPGQDHDHDQEHEPSDDQSKSSGDPKVNEALSRARRQFDRLDADGNGVLEGEELEALAEWVWSSFHPGGEALPPGERQKQADILVGQMDLNGDGVVDFDEFAACFQQICASIQGVGAKMYYSLHRDGDIDRNKSAAEHSHAHNIDNYRVSKNLNHDPNIWSIASPTSD